MMLQVIITLKSNISKERIRANLRVYNIECLYAKIQHS